MTDISMLHLHFSENIWNTITINREKWEILLLQYDPYATIYYIYCKYSGWWND